VIDFKDGHDFLLGKSFIDLTAQHKSIDTVGQGISC